MKTAQPKKKKELKSIKTTFFIFLSFLAQQTCSHVVRSATLMADVIKPIPFKAYSRHTAMSLKKPFAALFSDCGLVKQF